MDLERSAKTAAFITSMVEDILQAHQQHTEI